MPPASSDAALQRLQQREWRRLRRAETPQRRSGGGRVILEEDLFALRGIWSDVTHRIAALRESTYVWERILSSESPAEMLEAICSSDEMLTE